MSITVVGSVAYDTVTTSYGKSIKQLGGSAIYFSIAASKFTNVYPVGVYGDDFDNSDIKLLLDNSINISNLNPISFCKKYANINIKNKICF